MSYFLIIIARRRSPRLLSFKYCSRDNSCRRNAAAVCYSQTELQPQDRRRICKAIPVKNVVECKESAGELSNKIRGTQIFRRHGGCPSAHVCGARNFSISAILFIRARVSLHRIGSCVFTSFPLLNTKNQVCLSVRVERWMRSNPEVVCRVMCLKCIG